MSNPYAILQDVPALAEAFDVQVEVLHEFRGRAKRVLAGVCALHEYTTDDLSVERNLFSALFLAAQSAAGLTPARSLFFGLINQCMRAWVTACDNLLDDESKSVIPYALGNGGFRFVSVLTIMTADRILSDLLAEEVQAGRLTAERACALSHRSLHVLVPSGLQEHEEELGAASILPPDQVLEQIHVPKTGLLFEAPVAVPALLGEIGASVAAPAREGLRAFGLACQIFDDIVDFDNDVRDGRHNYVHSLAVHSNGSPRGAGRGALLAEPAMEKACTRALSLFADAREKLAAAGLHFSDEHWWALVWAIAGRLRLPDAAGEQIAASARRICPAA